jgi:hypothetical protein
MVKSKKVELTSFSSKPTNNRDGRIPEKKKQDF